MHTTLSFPIPLSESEELQSWGCSKILLLFLMTFNSHFWTNQQQQQCLLLFESILDGHLSLVIFYKLSPVSKSRIPPKNLLLVQKLFPIRKRFAPILVFLSQIDRPWNKILWQLSVHFRHPWRVKKSDFTRQVINRTLSKINKWNSMCERMLVDST